MANKQNLKGYGFDERTASEQRKIARAGGIASGKARRERKTIADALRAELDKPIGNGSKMTKREYLAAQCIIGLKDSVSPAELRVLSDILGELKQNIDITGNGLPIPQPISIEVIDRREQVDRPTEDE